MERFADLETYFDLFDESVSWRFQNEYLYVQESIMESPIRIHATQLARLNKLEKPKDSSGFRYLGVYGIRAGRYHELAIRITYPFGEFLEGNSWRPKPLRFKIGTQQVEVGPMTKAMVLLTEPLYADSDFGHEAFKNFESVKLLVQPEDDYRALFIKCLYYLNRYYLRPVNAKVELLELKISESSTWDSDDPEMKKSLEATTRKRNLTRKDYKSTEPLILYNAAILATGSHKFLLYYRVLEYFLKQGLIDEVRELRYSESIDEESLIKAVQGSSEVDLLEKLVNRAFRSKYIKTHVFKLLLTHGLIEKESLSVFTRRLYAFRNSIVHAKSEEKAKTTFPDPFRQDVRLVQWTVVVEILAERCIEMYNGVHRGKAKKTPK